MTLESNKELARTWWEKVMNGRDPSAIDNAYAEDYVYTGPEGRLVRGRDDAKQFARRLLAAVPDRVSTIEAQVAEGNLVTTRWMSRGTQTGPLMGNPPTNKPVVVMGITISRIENNRITEDWEILHIIPE